MKQTEEQYHDSLAGEEVYILKIYRRGHPGAEHMVGTIEDITALTRGVFRTGEELLQWLSSREKGVDADRNARET